MTPEEQSKLDQSTAGLVDMLVPMWRRLYLRCIEEGWSEADSLRLLQTYILAQCPHGVRGSDG